jgi:L-rhamnono-1,4-lactonase
MSPTYPILDSHIHLWPASAADENGHAWMNDPDFILSKQHILSDYTAASSSCPPTGVIYVETDRHLQDPSSSSLETWAAEPIKELQFLRSIVEGEYGAEASSLLQGIVAWAPVNQGLEVFQQWLDLAEKTTGPQTWKRIKGFRFLLQAITDKTEFENLVLSNDFISILKSFSQREKRFTFDVGIDQNSGGTWQLETLTKVLEKVYAGVPEHERTVLVLSKKTLPLLCLRIQDN